MYIAINISHPDSKGVDKKIADKSYVMRADTDCLLNLKIIIFINKIS